MAGVLGGVFLVLGAGSEVGRTEEKQGAAWYRIPLMPENSQFSYNFKWGEV